MKIKKFYALISILLADCYHTHKTASLSDAEVFEDIFKDVFVGNAACDFG